MLRIVSFLMALTLVSALAFGGFVHAVVPHDDGDAHHQGHLIVWGTLHSALQHEDKWLATMAAYLLFALGLVVVNSFFRLSPVFAARLFDERDRHLRKGIVSYRRFR